MANVDPNVLDQATIMELFDQQVTLQYQNSQKLQGTVSERHGTKGDATNVPVSDLIEMQEASFAAGNPSITDVVSSNRTIVPHNFQLKTFVGGAEETLYNYNKVEDHSTLHGKAAGRMADFIRLQAIYAQQNIKNLFTVVSKTVGPNTGLNEQKLSKALAIQENNGVDIMEGENSLWLPAAIKPGLFADNTFTSQFFNDHRPLTDFQMGEPQGIVPKTLGAAGINTIPYTSSSGTDTYLVPLVHKSSIVQIFNRDLQTYVEYVARNDRWEIMSAFTSGASVIQEEGIVLIECENPSSPN